MAEVVEDLPKGGYFGIRQRYERGTRYDDVKITIDQPATDEKLPNVLFIAVDDLRNVNGQLVGIDPIPFTPFNSNVVRFRAKAPITYAFKLVDWEENLGLGSEDNRGNAYHPGDAGLIASFSDGTVTNADWKAQVYYIAPVDDPSNVVMLGDGTRDSSAANQTTGSANSYGLHWQVPTDWASPDFDDSAWPNATIFTNETVGVDNKPSYTNFDDQFAGAGASFIWSSNLVLDNEVLVRYTRD